MSLIPVEEIKNEQFKAGQIWRDFKNDILIVILHVDGNILHIRVFYPYTICHTVFFEHVIRNDFKYIAIEDHIPIFKQQYDDWISKKAGIFTITVQKLLVEIFET